MTEERFATIRSNFFGDFSGMIAWSHRHFVGDFDRWSSPLPQEVLLLGMFQFEGREEEPIFQKNCISFFQGGSSCPGSLIRTNQKRKPSWGGCVAISLSDKVVTWSCRDQEYRLFYRPLLQKRPIIFSTKSSLDHVEINRQIVTSKVVICIWSCRTWRRRTWSYCSWSSLNLSACRPTSRRLHLIMATNCQNIVCFIGLFCKRDP